MRTLLLLLLAALPLAAQPTPDPWRLAADRLDPAHYYGVTVANGVLGIVSSHEPFRVKNVVLAGAYDQYGRGRVSNFLNGFNLLNMYLDVDGRRLGPTDAQHMRQELDMQRAAFTTTFDYQDKATITYTYYALRHLPYTMLLDVSIVAKKDLALTAASVIIMPALSWFERRTGLELGSASAVADSKQTLVCSYLSAALLVGLVLNAAFGWSWADPIAALIIAGFAIREGLEAWGGETCVQPVSTLIDDSSEAPNCSCH